MFSLMGDPKVLDSAGIDVGVREYCALSTDTKPTQDIVNGSTCLEMDTKKVYIFDEDNTQWRAL